MTRSPTGKKHIFALVTAAFGGRGGIAQFNRDLLLAWALPDQVEAISILPRHREDLASGLPALVTQFEPSRSRLRFCVMALLLTWRLRPSIIFCGHLYMAPLAVLIAKLLRMPLIVQLHGIDIWKKPSAAQRWSLEAADLILCVSRDTRARALSAARLPPERVVIVPNTVGDGYDPGDRDASRRKMGLASTRVLLSVGRLDSREGYKGHDRLFPIVAQLIREAQDVLYIIAGEGDDRPRLERLAAEAGVTDHVRFLGYVEGASLPDLYRAADLFVLPSHGEGFGIVYLEAMACGTPAIGLAAGGALDALEEFGQAVRPEDLGAAIRATLDRGLLDREALSARVRARFGRSQFERSARPVLVRIDRMRKGAPRPRAARI